MLDTGSAPIRPDHYGRHSPHRLAASRALPWAVALTASYAVVELVGGLLTGSLALVSDAGHMFTDAAALTLALLGARLAQRPPSARHSFGLQRAEVVAALLNGIFMLLLIAVIAVTAIGRLREPVPVLAGWTIVIALLGLLVNVVVALLLSRGEQTLNTRAALLHVLADLLGSLAALASGVVIYFTGWFAVDPLLSLLIVALILISAARLVRHALHVLLEGVPDWLELDQVRTAIAAIEGIGEVRQLRIWNIGSGHAALAAHVVLAPDADWERVACEAARLLRERYAINDVTLQPRRAGRPGLP